MYRLSSGVCMKRKSKARHDASAQRTDARANSDVKMGYIQTLCLQLRSVIVCDSRTLEYLLLHPQCIVYW